MAAKTPHQGSGSGTSSTSGPKFKRTKAAPAMRDAARRLISKKGLAGLNFRDVAGGVKPKVSHSAPLHHFGTIEGLLGAVASQAFDEIAADLRATRESKPITLDTLVRLAQQLAKFSLDNHRLYQAIHSPKLWAAYSGYFEGRTKGGSGDKELKNASGPSGKKTSSRRSSEERATPWLQEAFASRDAAVREFSKAASDLGANNQVDPAVKPKDLARMVTVLVDGYLFQYLNEWVDRKSEKPDPMVIKKVGTIVRLALRGAQRRS
ncbi:MAG: TetR/AcrR family transcriptional regulator [bacterium]|nr:TetR/AcrR family transcriptional regulator [bacterium]